MSQKQQLPARFLVQWSRSLVRIRGGRFDIS